VAADLQAKVFRFVSTNEYEVEADFDLRVSNTSGDISVRYQPGDKVVIEVVKEIRADDRDEAEQIEERLQAIIKAERSSIEIDTRYPRWREGDSFWEKIFDIRKSDFGRVHYNIELPVSAELDLSSTSGDMILRGLSGRLNVEVTSGDLEIIDHTGDCTIRSTSGELRARNIKGMVDINSTSADILIDNAVGDVELRSTSGDSEIYWVVGNVFVTKTSGDVVIEDCSGDVDVSTSSGDVYLTQEEGGIFVETSSGDVRIRSQFKMGDRYEVETVSGDITFQVPAEMEGRVQMETVSGSIDTDLTLEVRHLGRRRLEGSVGNGGPTIQLSTSSGDISLEEF
jgi:DUF4097 and DUF4098 domain-containing protein YvlB